MKRAFWNFLNIRLILRYLDTGLCCLPDSIEIYIRQTIITMAVKGGSFQAAYMIGNTINEKQGDETAVIRKICNIALRIDREAVYKEAVTNLKPYEVAGYFLTVIDDRALFLYNNKLQNPWLRAVGFAACTNLLVRYNYYL